MEFTKYFKKETEKSYRCFINTLTNNDNVVQEK